MSYENKKILLTGGGTGGSVSPLLAIISPLLTNERDGMRFEFLWIGTKNGVEKGMVEKERIKFKAIASGKFRRYFSFKNLTDLILIKLGFFQSLFIILKWKPDLIMSAGSFVSVPVVWAGWILHVPILIHQQDVRPGLANKLMAPFAKVITVTFEESLKDYGKKAVWTGNPARQLAINESGEKIKFDNNRPVVLVIGGGTGSVAINKLIKENLSELTKFCNIIHITGRGKDNKLILNNYQLFEFLNFNQMVEAYNSADIVVSRAGMGVLTELANLGKPAILIPIPDSHQEENAEIFRKKEAAVVLSQNNLTAENFTDNIKKLLNDTEAKNKLSGNIKKVIKRGANEKFIEITKNILKI